MEFHGFHIAKPHEYKAAGIAVGANGKPSRFVSPAHVFVPDDPLHSVKHKGYVKASQFATGMKLQTVYSTIHNGRAKEAKFNRVKEMAKVMPKIDKHFAGNANKVGTREGDTAAVGQIIRATGMRVGSKDELQAPGKQKAFGATTLQHRHVTVSGNNVRFQFIGKKQVAQDHTVIHPGIANSIRERQALPHGPNDPLFPKTSDGILLSTLKRVGHPEMLTKDMRTHKAAEVAALALKRLESSKGFVPPKTTAQFNKMRMVVATQVAKVLGNEPKEALDSYIPPEIFGRLAP
jgi:DNA topoisomerase-1